MDWLSEDAPLCVAVALAPSTLAVAFTPAPEVEFDTTPPLAVAFALTEAPALALALERSAAELAPSEALAFCRPDRQRLRAELLYTCDALTESDRGAIECASFDAVLVVRAAPVPETCEDGIVGTLIGRVTDEAGGAAAREAECFAEELEEIARELEETCVDSLALEVERRCVDVECPEELERTLDVVRTVVELWAGLEDVWGAVEKGKDDVDGFAATVAVTVTVTVTSSEMDLRAYICANFGSLLDAS